MIKRYFAPALIAATLTTASLAQASVLNLDNGSGTINGASFATTSQQPTGTGVFNPFLTVQNSPWEQGYNSSTGDFDTKREPVWNHEIHFSDLQVTTINGTQYYGFSIDVNEPNGAKAGISLDAFSIWTSATVQNSTSTNSSGYFNGSLGTLRYDLGANSVTYTDVQNGSGSGDINIFIPVSNFAGAQPNDYVYVYERFGNSDPTTTTQGGFEETSLIRGITPVPEMSALFPIVGLMVAVGSTHMLRRRKLARMQS